MKRRNPAPVFQGDDLEFWTAYLAYALDRAKHYDDASSLDLATLEEMRSDLDAYHENVHTECVSEETHDQVIAERDAFEKDFTIAIKANEALERSNENLRVSLEAHNELPKSVKNLKKYIKELERQNKYLASELEGCKKLKLLRR